MPRSPRSVLLAGALVSLAVATCVLTIIVAAHHSRAEAIVFFSLSLTLLTMGGAARIEAL